MTETHIHRRIYELTDTQIHRYIKRRQKNFHLAGVTINAAVIIQGYFIIQVTMSQCYDLEAQPRSNYQEKGSKAKVSNVRPGPRSTQGQTTKINEQGQSLKRKTNAKVNARSNHKGQ